MYIYIHIKYAYIYIYTYIYIYMYVHVYLYQGLFEDAELISIYESIMRDWLKMLNISIYIVLCLRM